MIASVLKVSLATLLVSTLLWASVVLYLRSHRREDLERDAAAIPSDERESYIREGMRSHSRSMLRISVILTWLAAGIFVAGLIWYVNFN